MGGNCVARQFSSRSASRANLPLAPHLNQKALVANREAGVPLAVAPDGPTLQWQRKKKAPSARCRRVQSRLGEIRSCIPRPELLFIDESIRIAELVPRRAAATRRPACLIHLGELTIGSQKTRVADLSESFQHVFSHMYLTKCLHCSWIL